MTLKEYLMIKQAFNTPTMPGSIQYVGNNSKPQIDSNKSVLVNKPTDVNDKPRGRVFPKYLGLLGAVGGGTLDAPSPKLRRMRARMRAGITPLD